MSDEIVTTLLRLADLDPKVTQIVDEAFFRNAAAEFKRLRTLLDETVREREDFNGAHQEACLEIAELRSQLGEANSRLEHNRLNYNEAEKECERLRSQLVKCREALAVAQMAYEAMHGRVGYVQFRELEAKADELRKAILTDELIDAQAND